MICFIENQSINYEEACTKILYSSKKDCSVAPWEDNKRCCYISYIENGVRKGQCIFIEDTKSSMKSTKSEFSNSGKSKVKIECYLSDGIVDVPMDGINTILIAGMGISTIISILKDNSKLKYVKKIILQTNNNYEELRRFMNSINYYLEKEEYVYDKGKWYIMMEYSISNKLNTEEELKYGYISKDYAIYLIDNYKKICNRIPKGNKDYNKYEDLIKEIETMIK